VWKGKGFGDLGIPDGHDLGRCYDVMMVLDLKGVDIDRYMGKWGVILHWI